MNKYAQLTNYRAIPFSVMHVGAMVRVFALMLCCVAISSLMPALARGSLILDKVKYEWGESIFSVPQKKFPVIVLGEFVCKHLSLPCDL